MSDEFQNDINLFKISAMEPENYPDDSSEYPKQLHDLILPLPKLAALLFVSGGMYLIYWVYRNWKHLKAHEMLRISSFWRSFFSPIFIFSQFLKLHHLAVTSEETPRWNAIIFGACFLIIHIANRIVSRSSTLDSTTVILYLIATLLLYLITLSIQFTLNRTWLKLYPASHITYKLRYPEILFTIWGIGIMILSLL